MHAVHEIKWRTVEITISYHGYARCSTPDCDAPVDPKTPPAVTLDRPLGLSPSAAESTVTASREPLEPRPEPERAPSAAPPSAAPPSAAPPPSPTDAVYAPAALSRASCAPSHNPHTGSTRPATPPHGQHRTLHGRVARDRREGGRVVLPHAQKVEDHLVRTRARARVRVRVGVRVRVRVNAEDHVDEAERRGEQRVVGPAARELVRVRVGG
eukprot:scaffold101528_cov63-Phaeocystis_antarctica.AAC.2